MDFLVFLLVMSMRETFVAVSMLAFVNLRQGSDIDSSEPIECLQLVAVTLRAKASGPLGRLFPAVISSAETPHQSTLLQILSTIFKAAPKPWKDSLIWIHSHRIGVHLVWR